MEEAYFDDIEDNIEADIFSLWLHAYPKDAYEDYKICDLAEKFNTSIETVIKSVKEVLNTEFLDILSEKELKGMYLALKRNEESLGNRVQMAIIKSVLNERNQ